MFTILMSVYKGEQTSHFIEAFDSLIAMGGSSAIDEVILVLDGPVGAEIHAAIESFNRRLPLRVVPREENQGLAVALNHGLSLVQSPWVMRFDTDDVCMPHRLESQIELAKSGEFDLFGSQIDEFELSSARPVQSRRVPITHEDIVRYSLRRNPFNHMTVCFRTALAQKAGGYPHLPYMEDYALWVKMIQMGAQTCNSSDALVKARIGAGMYTRRGGWVYAKCEYQLQRYFVNLGHKTWLRALVDGAFRGAVFLSPVQVRRWIYENFLRR